MLRNFFGPILQTRLPAAASASRLLQTAAQAQDESIDASGFDQAPRHLPQQSQAFTAPRPKQPAWWEDKNMDARNAYRIISKRLQLEGPQRERHLHELFERCRTHEDAELALKALQLARRHKAARQQHTPFNHRTCKLLIQSALDCGAPDVATAALEKATALGIDTGTKVWDSVAIAHSKEGDLDSVVKVYNAMKAAGVKPSSDTAFVLARACVDNGKVDLGIKLLKELEVSGVRIRTTVWQLLGRGPGGIITPAPDPPAAAGLPLAAAVAAAAGKIPAPVDVLPADSAEISAGGNAAAGLVAPAGAGGGAGKPSTAAAGSAPEAAADVPAAAAAL